jgi:hypothetical protein
VAFILKGNFLSSQSGEPKIRRCKKCGDHQEDLAKSGYK